MFWQKKNTTTPIKTEELKLPGPKEIPEAIARHLVIHMKRDPDQTWNLKAVVRPRNDNRDSYDFRVFSDTQTGSAGVRVKDFTSLESHPDLIIYQGWYNKKNQEVHID